MLRWVDGETTYNAQVPVNCCDTLVCASLQQFGCDDLLDRQNDAVLAPNADRCAAILNCLHGIFDLEVAAVGREDGIGEIVTCSYRRLRVHIVSF